MLKKRASGILLHFTSLPSRYSIGDFGPDAYRFVDFLKQAGQSYWQILPLNYTTAKTGYSPYNCFSAFAGNPLLISPDLLYRDGLIQQNELKKPPDFPFEKVDYRRAWAWKSKLLDRAFLKFRTSHKPADYDEFVEKNTFWLADFAIFVALKRHFGKCPLSDWPVQIRDRKRQVRWFLGGQALKSISKQLKRDIERELFIQYIFYKQYSDLRKYCKRQGIKIIGDIPIYVAYDSADVWANPELFKLTKTKKPRYIAGVPPDYFSRTGQLWGNPVYDWQYLKVRNFTWWIERMKHNLRLFDLVRIDHFRGFVAYWQVPAWHKTAIYGRWVDGPKEKFFQALIKQIGSVPIFVEDLGTIGPDVRQLIAKFGFPSMRILQFGFEADSVSNPHYPDNHIANCLVYTGTHDNNTTRGWFEKELSPKKRKHIFNYLGHKVAVSEIHWEMIRLAMSSVAKIAIIPMQDILGLGAEARMNHPARKKGNWLWRTSRKQLTSALAKKLRKLVETYGRR